MVFTVIMPVFNGRDCILNALLSVKNQSHSDYVLLIINDGSTDDTLDILSPYLNDKIRLINLKNNSGLTNALKIGVSHATTDWVARLDADDTWEPTHLEKLNELISENDDLVLCANRSTLCRKVKHKVYTSFILKQLVWNNPFIHSAVAFKKEAYSQVGGYQYEKFEDYGLWIRILRVGNAVISEHHTVNHIKSSGSLSDIGAFQSTAYRVSYQLLALGDTKPVKYLIRIIQLLVLVFARCRFKI